MRIDEVQGDSRSCALGGMKPPAISAIPAMIEALQREDTGQIKWIQSFDIPGSSQGGGQSIGRHGNRSDTSIDTGFA